MRNACSMVTSLNDARRESARRLATASNIGRNAIARQPMFRQSTMNSVAPNEERERWASARSAT